jgi:hypothetical protein
VLRFNKNTGTINKTAATIKVKNGCPLFKSGHRQQINFIFPVHRANVGFPII